MIKIRQVEEYNELINLEWLLKISWQNKAYLRKLDGLTSKQVDMEGLRSIVNRLVSPQLAIAGHLDDNMLIREVCCQILAILRFLPDKERKHKVELMRAAFGFDFDITGDFISISEAFAKYQKKLDFRKKWLWFLPLKQLTFPEHCN